MTKKGDRKKETYLVVGLGRFGSSLCDGLIRNGATVIAVERDMAIVDEFSDRVEYIARLDATDEAALLKAGAKDADTAIVCLGEKNQAAIMASAILMDIGIPKVIACAYDNMQERILRKLGVHQVIRPHIAMGLRTAEMLIKPWLSSFADIGDDIHVAGKITAPEAICGTPLKELALPSRYGMTIVSVVRNGRRMLPRADLVLERGDTMLVFGEKDRMGVLFDISDIDTHGQLGN